MARKRNCGASASSNAASVADLARSPPTSRSSALVTFLDGLEFGFLENLIGNVECCPHKRTFA
jgi:hypothetical protein